MDLKPFPNILKELGEKKAVNQILVGFALETRDAMAHAKAKMEARNCDAMVVNNPVAPDSGFGKSKVQAAILRRGGKGKPALTEWDKDELAAALVAEVASLLQD
jgi:phosphopantothenoylcysteine decarboxylase/phosphopantothenate--cysteine ligase